MEELFLQPRVVESKDWATLLFVLCLILIVLAKSVSENRFYDFLRILINDKYVKIYKDGIHLMSWFTVLLFIVQLISFSFFVLVIMDYFGWSSKTDSIMFVRVFTLLGFFILSKYLVEKIIAATFSIEEFSQQFNLQKVSYRTFIGLLILPPVVYMYYNTVNSLALVYSLIVIVLVINVFSYLISLRRYQNSIVNKMFYFILYLCALEIAPYYFMYYWFTKS